MERHGAGVVDTIDRIAGDRRVVNFERSAGDVFDTVALVAGDHHVLGGAGSSIDTDFNRAGIVNTVTVVAVDRRADDVELAGSRVFDTVIPVIGDIHVIDLVTRGGNEVEQVVNTILVVVGDLDRRILIHTGTPKVHVTIVVDTVHPVVVDRHIVERDRICAVARIWSTWSGVFDTVPGVVGDHHIVGGADLAGLFVDGSDKQFSVSVVDTMTPVLGSINALVGFRIGRATVIGNRGFRDVNFTFDRLVILDQSIHVLDTAGVVLGDQDRIRRVPVQIHLTGFVVDTVTAGDIIVRIKFTTDRHIVDSDITFLVFDTIPFVFVDHHITGPSVALGADLNLGVPGKNTMGLIVFDRRFRDFQSMMIINMI